MMQSRQSNSGRGWPLDPKLEPLWDAFCAGFDFTWEGFNGEYPHVGHPGYPDLQRRLRREFERWVSENVLIGE